MKNYSNVFRILALVTIVSLFSFSCSAQESPKAGKTRDSRRNPVIESIMTRTSVRSYDGRMISPDTVEMLLRAGMAAPTARNVQPWHFVVINEKGMMEKLSKTNPHSKMLQTAPLAIVVCGDMKKAMDGDGREFWVQDCSAATENILIAAHALGLGAVWTGAYPIKERVRAIKEVLNMPENLVPLCVIVIGYPAERPAPKNKWKQENVTYNKF